MTDATVTIDKLPKLSGAPPPKVEGEARALNLTIRPDWRGRPALTVDEARRTRNRPRPSQLRPRRAGRTPRYVIPQYSQCLCRRLRLRLAKRIEDAAAIGDCSSH